MKKIFILFLISIVIFSGGCNGGSSSLISTETATSLWISSSGTATIATDADNVEAFSEAFKDIPSDLLEQYKAEANSADAFVEKSVVFVEADGNDKAKLSAIIIVKNDNKVVPITYSSVELTQKNENEWATSDGLLSLNMSSGVFSGKIRDCEFSTSLTKKEYDTSIELSEILGGTWELNGTACGGASKDNIFIPETVSMFFDTTEEKIKAYMFYSLKVDEDALYQEVVSCDGTLTKIYEDVYEFIETNGNETLILVENTNEILIFRDDLFLPLKKVSFNLETFLAKSWKASNGGGYVKLSNNATGDEFENLLYKLLDTISLNLKNGNLSFSKNNDSVTVNLNALFSLTNENFTALGIPEENIEISSSENFTVAGNFLQFVDADEIDTIVFLSETEIFASSESLDKDVEGKLVMRFYAE